MLRLINNKIFISVLLLIIIGGGLVFFLQNNSQEKSEDFYNPILTDGADPWMTKHEDYYVYTQTTGHNLQIWKTDSPTSLMNAKKKIIWEPTPGTPNSNNIWAPEVHFIEGKWYVYYAASDASGEHRMYVLESENEDPFSDYTDLGQITDPTNKWGIDGTVIQHDGELYYVWSGWEGDTNVSQQLYIAGMENPSTVNTDRVEISRPDFRWEKEGGSPSINEGPQILYTENLIHIVYSGSGSWSDFYKLGILSAERDANLLDPDAWTKSETPVFESGNNVYGPGHASFVQSPDGSENWIVYHAAKEQGSGWTRNVRMQPFSIDNNEFPDFGEPTSVSESLPLPSGDPVEIYRVENEEMEINENQISFDAKLPESGEYYLYLYWSYDGAVNVNGTVNSNSPFTLYADSQGLLNEELTVSSYKVQVSEGNNVVELNINNGHFDLKHAEFKNF